MDSHNARIELAIAEIANSEAPNITGIARKYALNHTTLRRRYLGLQTSRRAANSECRQRLTLAQEEVLIQHLNMLSARGLSPTTHFIRTLAEEAVGGPIGKNWTSNFVKRYKDRLKLPLSTQRRQRTSAS